MDAVSTKLNSVRRPDRRRVLGAVVSSGVALFFLLSGSSQSAEPPASDAGQVMAASLQRLPAYVQGPAGTYPATNEAWHIGVLGGDPLGLALEEILPATNHPAGGRAIEIWHAAQPEDLPPCQIIFIQFQKSDQIQTALARLAGQPVLTVGEADDFLKLGGIIQLQRAHTTIHMNINLDAARAAGLTIPASLLELASLVVVNGQTSPPGKRLLSGSREPTPP